MIKKSLFALCGLCLLLAACGGAAAPQPAEATATQVDEQPPTPPHVPPLEGAQGMVLADINWYVNGDTLVMFGMAQNNGASDLYDVMVTVSLLNAASQTVDAGSRELPVLEAGGQAPFIVTFPADLEWEGYEAVFLELPAGPNTVLYAQDFEIVSASQVPGSCHSVPDSVFDLGIEVKQVGEMHGDAHELLAALFDPSGNIIAVSAAWICAETDDSIFFEVSVGPAEIAEGEIDGYELFVYGYVLGG
ncbi:MAG: hypothetical protein KIS80_07370 [Anaerolineales bacterium]|nr:hypothetical protein [Anaerolineales bacterium]